MKSARPHSTLAATLLMVALAACSPSPSGEASLGAAQKSFELGDYEAAGQMARNVLANASDDPQARLLFGRILLESGNAKAGETELRRAMESGAPAPQVRPFLARAIVTAGEPKRALQELSSSVEGTEAERAELLAVLAEAKARLGDAAGAQALVQQAHGLQPDSVAASLVEARLLAAGKGGAAAGLAVLDRVLAKQPEQHDLLRLKGELLMHGQRDFAAATQVLSQLVKLRPRELDGQVALVYALLIQGKVTEARAQLKALQGVYPRAFPVLLLDTQLTLNEGQFSQANEKAQALLKVAPDHPAAAVLAGGAQLSLGALPQAEQTLSRVLFLDKNSVAARRYLAATRLRMGRPEQAWETLQPLLSANPPDMVAVGIAAEVRLAEGRFVEAERLFSRVVAARPDDLRGQVALAQAQQAQGQHDRALASLATLAQSSGGATAHGALINAHIRASQFDKALAACQAFAEKEPSSPLPHLLEARVRALMGDRAGQVKALQDTLAKDKQNFSATMALALVDRRAGDLPAARQRLVRFLEADPRAAHAWTALAALEAASGPKGLQAEEETLRKAVDAAPASAELQVLLVQNLLRQRRHVEALNVASKAEASFKGRADITEAAGAAQMASGDLNQAQKSYASLSTLLPHDPRPLLTLARVQLSAGNSDQAVRSLQRAIELAPGATPNTLAAMRMLVSVKGAGAAAQLLAGLKSKHAQSAWPHVVEAELLLDQKQGEKALQAFKSGLDKQQATVAAVGYSGSLLNLRRTAEARAFAATWIKENPKDHVFLRHLGDRALLAGDLDEAERQFRASVALAPQDALSQNNLAWTLVRKNDPKALEPARRAIGLAPGEPAVMDTFAAALQTAGQTPAATDILLQLVDQYPERHVSRLKLARLLIANGDKAAAKRQLDTLAKAGAAFAQQGEVKALLGKL